MGEDAEAGGAEPKGCGPCKAKDDTPLADDQRKCRDILFFLAFILFWVGGFVIAGLGFKQGSPLTLIFGLDYQGGVCNKMNTNNGTDFDLRGLAYKYWVNPNQVLSSNGYGFNLADAESICLGSCPALMPNGNLSWVCKYPQDADGTQNVNRSRVPNLGAWKAMNYNYFSLLNQSEVVSSCQMQGPCYPVLTLQRSVLHVCQYETMYNLPMNPLIVGDLQQCFSCCQNTSQPVCNATDSLGLPMYFNYQGNVSTPNGYVNCLSSCQDLHESIDDLVASSTASIYPLAYLTFQQTCKALTGQQAARVPAPSTGDGGAAEAVAASLVASKKSMAERAVGDVLTGWKALVVTGLFLPFILSFVYLILLRFFAGPMVYVTVLLANLASLGATLYCFSKAGLIGKNSLSQVANVSGGSLKYNGTAANLAFQQAANQSSAYNGQAQQLSFNTSSAAYSSLQDVAHDQALQMYYIGIVAAVFTVGLFIFTLVMIPRLKIAIATIKVACETLKAVPFLVLFPLFSTFCMVLLLIWWVAVGLFIYSSGQIVKRNCCGEVQAEFQELYPGLPASVVPSCGQINCGFTVVMNKALQHTLIYHGFELLWTTQYILAYGMLVVAQVAWLFYNHSGSGADMPLMPIMRAMKNAAWYYPGSIAIGSFVVASVQFARLVLAYVESKSQKLQEGNKLVKFLFAIANCLMLCLQKMIELINRNAYIVIAIEGSGFCSAAAKAIKLLVSNSSRIGVTNVISDVVLFLGKIAVSAASAFFCFVYLDHEYPDGSISSPILPVIIVFIAAFAITCMFFAVVEMCVDTTIIAFCDDCDKNGGEPKYSPPLLMEAMGVSAQVTKDIKEKTAKVLGGGGGGEAIKTEVNA